MIYHITHVQLQQSHSNHGTCLDYLCIISAFTLHNDTRLHSDPWPSKHIPEISSLVMQ